MTIDDLERGMKLLFDQHVHFVEDLDRLEASQKRTDQQIAELTLDQKVAMKAILSVVGSVGNLAESLKHTDATVAALAESQKRTDATVAELARRIDAFIAALGNGRQKSS